MFYPTIKDHCVKSFHCFKFKLRSGGSRAQAGAPSCSAVPACINQGHGPTVTPRGPLAATRKSHLFIFLLPSPILISHQSSSQVHLTSYPLSGPISTCLVQSQSFSTHPPPPRLATAVTSPAQLSGLEYVGAEAQPAYIARQSLAKRKVLVLDSVTTQGGRRAQCSGLCCFGLAPHSLCQPAAL